ncbi:hypothetical protein AAG747_18065 [Rapidithrix thailandica]|uniref:NVEALA family protein n=1 Tax=Rapidithrix thailandica TaxID=413964 RepID=A0AAW9SG44_9BACT
MKSKKKFLLQGIVCMTLIAFTYINVSSSIEFGKSASGSANVDLHSLQAKALDCNEGHEGKGKQYWYDRWKLGCDSSTEQTCCFS